MQALESRVQLGQKRTLRRDLFSISTKWAALKVLPANPQLVARSKFQLRHAADHIKKCQTALNLRPMSIPTRTNFFPLAHYRGEMVKENQWLAIA